MAKYFTLNTGAKIPSIGLGTYSAAPNVVGDAVITAVKAGYRHIDCARLYKNEKEVKLVRGDWFIHPQSIYKSVEELWMAKSKHLDELFLVKVKY
ncbi:Aldo-keto reductase family 4 member C10 [Ananas comosus]|uniref:Aldo-keto reductase family 4 member C10 n=1 Tax=Ananas comosus TaxID=4615 RepID=A0A199VJ74_ANACO|nr:Aldo-keto reductase family 4 member C10 [Ananas comosus]